MLRFFSKRTIFVLTFPLAFSACQGINIEALADKEKTFETTDNYQLVYKRYLNWFHQCGMRGWKIVPMLLPELHEGSIEVSNLTGPLAYIKIDGKTDGVTHVKYSTAIVPYNQTMEILYLVGNSDIDKCPKPN